MINKDNVNLQITLNKSAYKVLKNLIKHYEDTEGITYTKSNIIAKSLLYLNNNVNITSDIKSSETPQPKPTIINNVMPMDKSQPKLERTKINTNAIKPTQEMKENNIWQYRICLIRYVLNQPAPRIAEQIGISLTSIKKYIRGIKNPSLENQKLIIDFMKQNNIND